MKKLLYDKSLHVHGSLRVQVGGDLSANWRGPVVITTYGGGGGQRNIYGTKTSEARAWAIAVLEACKVADDEYGLEVDEKGEATLIVDLVDNTQTKRPKLRSAA
jgi:hypothetical protein